jgi:hypothetical protein
VGRDPRRRQAGSEGGVTALRHQNRHAARDYDGRRLLRMCAGDDRFLPRSADPRRRTARRSCVARGPKRCSVRLRRRLTRGRGGRLRRGRSGGARRVALRCGTGPGQSAGRIARGPTSSSRRRRSVAGTVLRRWTRGGLALRRSGSRRGRRARSTLRCGTR